MAPKPFVLPVVPTVTAWNEVTFIQPLFGWNELAAYMAAKSSAPCRSANAYRLAFWAGRISIRAVHYGQRIVFDRKSVDSWINLNGGKTQQGGVTKTF